MSHNRQETGRHQIVALSALLLLSGCGDLEGDDGAARGHLSAALTTTFAKTNPLCPTTTNWGAWSQTSLTTWDSDVKPVVGWIINRTGISSSTYSGHSPSIGRAADWRPHSRDEGTQLANWFLANTKSGGKPLGIDYIIWQAQIYLISSGVTALADRGSFTQNHCDHIHISFVKSGSVSFDAASTTAWGSAPSPDAGSSHDVKIKPSPDATIKPSPDAGASIDQARADLAGGDAGDPLPEASDGLGAAPNSTAPSTLQGGCAVAPRSPDETSALGLLVIGLIGAIVFFRRR
jgi:hypothetical protein